MPKISIVLPTYNGERYIREAINSIINQTFKDWELIIVNDCSNDNTPTIIEEYKKRDARICVINNDTNKKLPASLNIGFKKAMGKYLTWTSDDNIYSNNAFEIMVDYLDEYKEYQMVCARMDFIDKDGKFLHKHIKYSDKLMYYNDCVGACFMYRSKVLREVGEYNVDRFCIEDYEYWMRILKQYGSIGFIDCELYKYRVHEESLTGKKQDYIKQQLLKYRLLEIDWLLDNLKDSPELITRMYCEFIHNEGEDLFLEKASMIVPELSLLKQKNDIKSYIVWGAGQYGRRALKALKNKIYCFADTNIDIVGDEIEGIPIISYEEMLQNTDKEICIAVWDGNVYDMIKDLYNAGIQHCRLAQEFV